MIFSYRLWVVLVGLAAVSICAAASPKQPEQPQKVTQNEGANEAGTRMGGLLDFANYKKLFKKSYSGMLEEAVRLKYYTASALKTAVAAVKYRFRLINHYLSLNHMSDWTRKEFEKLENKAFAIWASSVSKVRGQKPPASKPASGSPELVSGANENAAKDVRELVEEHKGEPVYEQLGELLGAKSPGQHKRSKRETGKVEPLPPRELPMEKLIHASEPEVSPEGWGNQHLNVRSNNPLFVPAELSTQGFYEAPPPVNWYSFESHDQAIYDLGPLASDLDVSRVTRMLVQQGGQPRDDKSDRVFVDLRETGCIAPVRDQGNCASCYAFTLIAIMEFLYCKNTGLKVPFSEQYVVDCGKHVGLEGCGGGSPTLVPNFLRNFGLYPSSLYPYRDQEGQCPYDGMPVRLEQTGYIRSADFANSLMISRELWGHALNFGPLMISVVAYFGSDFQAYGGGVLMGNCEGRPRHAVVLIGHGRQDGREYWLIRNSWGSDWGEGGYIRVDKECNCVKLNFGFAYGVSNPAQFNRMTFEDNSGALSELFGFPG